MARDLTFEIVFDSNGEPVIRRLAAAQADATREFLKTTSAAQQATAAYSAGNPTLERMIAQQKGLAESAKVAETQARLLGPGYLRLGENVGRASAETSRLVQAQGTFIGSARPLGTALMIAGTQVGQLGPATGIAANAITAMAVAGGPAGIALGALAGTVGLLVSRVTDARERMAELAEIELAGIGRETRGLQADAGVRERMRLMDAEGDKIRELDIQLDKFALEAEKAGADRGRVQSLASQSIAQALTQELSAIARMDAVTATNTFIRKENALAAAKQAGASADVVRALETEVAAASQRIAQLDQIDISAVGGKAGEAIRNQIREINTDLAGLSQQKFPFAFKFDELVKQLAEVKQSARETFGLEIPASIQQSISSMDSLIRTIAQEKNIKIGVEEDQAIADMQRVKSELDSIPSSKTIDIGVRFGALPGSGVQQFFSPGGIVPNISIQPTPFTLQGNVMAQGSPNLPFSEYFTSYAPGVVSNFSKRSRATLQMDMGQYMTSINAIIQSAQQAAGGLSTFFLHRELSEQHFGLSFTGEGAARERDALRNLIQDVRDQALVQGIKIDAADSWRDMFEFFTPEWLKMHSSPIAPLASGPSAQAAPGGFGGGATVNINLSHARITTEFLDEDLIPRLERALLRTTGQTGTFRILS